MQKKRSRASLEKGFDQNVNVSARCGSALKRSSTQCSGVQETVVMAALGTFLLLRMSRRKKEKNEGSSPENICRAETRGIYKIIHHRNWSPSTFFQKPHDAHCPLFFTENPRENGHR